MASALLPPACGRTTRSGGRPAPAAPPCSSKRQRLCGELRLPGPRDAQPAEERPAGAGGPAAAPRRRAEPRLAEARRPEAAGVPAGAAPGQPSAGAAGSAGAPCERPAGVVPRADAPAAAGRRQRAWPPRAAEAGACGVPAAAARLRPRAARAGPPPSPAGGSGGEAARAGRARRSLGPAVACAGDREAAARAAEAAGAAARAEEAAARAAEAEAAAGDRGEAAARAAEAAGAAPSARRFPSVPWAASMCGCLADELAAALGRGGERRRLRVGTDCAGAEAPLLALREICATLRQSQGIEVGVDHLFACDVNHASREFIARNTTPAALFGDLLARDGGISHCLLAEAPRQVPGDLDIYVAGFPCKDFSMLNHARPCLEGPNAAIYEGVVRYIQQHRPRAFILENVSGLMIKRKRHDDDSPVNVVMRTLRAIPGYQVRGWKVNTLEYWLPQSRKRVYIVGVNTDKVVLRRPLEDWGPLLKAQRGAPSVRAHSFMLPDEEPEVLAEHERAMDRLRRRRTRGPLAAERRGPAPAGRRGVAAAFRHAAARRQAAEGQCRYGRKWVRTHELYRKKHGFRGGQPWAGLREGWAPLVGSQRSTEVLELVARGVQRRARRDARCTHEIAEISRGIGCLSVMADHTPCVTPTSVLWVFQRERWMVGVEMMALQGFRPDDLDLTGLTESDIRHLAGNAMSVPVVGAFLLLLLSQVVFSRDGARPPPRARGRVRGGRRGTG